VTVVVAVAIHSTVQRKVRRARGSDNLHPLTTGNQVDVTPLLDIRSHSERAFVFLAEIDVRERSSLCQI